MELKTSSFKIAFKIEPSPGGGFVARDAERGIELQATTREELQAKMRDKLHELTGIGLDLNLTMGAAATAQTESFHIEKKFTINRSSPPAASAAELQATANKLLAQSGLSTQLGVDMPEESRAFGGARGFVHGLIVLLVGMLFYFAAAAEGISKPMIFALLGILLMGTMAVLAISKR